tara:strand:- start:1458 stop:2291 length:834 start_codon:yes stop_codon:yes gene_type:complete
MKTSQAVNFGSEILKANKILTYRLDSELILASILNTSREKLITSNLKIPKKNFSKFKDLIRRRSSKEPIAYILKKKEFVSENFFVDYKSLIPRPETELLIEPIIKHFKNKRLFFLDIGTGSGCILISILKNVDGSRGVGIDICNQTLINCRKNLLTFNLINRARVLHKSIDKLNDMKFDLIVANPPYIIKREFHRLPQDIKKFEPRIALDGGNDGLDVFRKVIYKSKYLLKSNGILALEIGTGQFSQVNSLLNENNFKNKILVKDYKNNIRCIFSTL